MDVTAVTRGFIAVCWVVFVVYIFVSAFFTKRTVERRGRGASRILLLVAFLVALVVVNFPNLSGDAFLAYAGVPVWPNSIIDALIADAVTLGGLIVVLWARTVLGGNWSAIAEVKEKHELITRGPYRYVRHPIYSGLLLMVLGVIIVFDRAVGVFVFAACFLSLWVKAHQEEKLLTEHFPQAYPEYKARVKALIPFVL
jgi:protein-S-isoprenylcysteine O-methyltransferase Ste14